MPRSSEQVRVDGVWLNQIAPWGDLVYSFAWPKGCDSASWAVYFAAGHRHPALRAGVLVEILDMGARIWVGRLSQTDWDQGSFTADGLYVDASCPALDASGNPTTIPSVGVDRAIVRGEAGFSGRSGVATSAITSADVSDNVNTLSDLLSADADLNGKRWGVFADGIVLMAVDATAVSWHLVAGSIELGEDDTDYASRLFGRYVRDIDGTMQTVTVEDALSIVQHGAVGAVVELKGWGPISTVTATSITQNILDRSRRSLGWTNSVDVSPYQLTTPGGGAADLSMVRSNQVVRAFDVWDGRQVQPYVDLLLGKVTRDTGSRTINLAPVDTQPQTLADVIASMQPKEET